MKSQTTFIWGVRLPGTLYDYDSMEKVKTLVPGKYHAGFEIFFKESDYAGNEKYSVHALSDFAIKYGFYCDDSKSQLSLHWGVPIILQEGSEDNDDKYAESDLTSLLEVFSGPEAASIKEKYDRLSTDTQALKGVPSPRLLMIRTPYGHI